MWCGSSCEVVQAQHDGHVNPPDPEFHEDVLHGVLGCGTVLQHLQGHGMEVSGGTSHRPPGSLLAPLLDPAEQLPILVFLDEIFQSFKRAKDSSNFNFATPARKQKAAAFPRGLRRPFPLRIGSSVFPEYLALCGSRWRVMCMKPWSEGASRRPSGGDPCRSSPGADE